MQAPNFTAVAAAFREQFDAAEWLRQRRDRWLARPLNEREEVIRDNLTHALREMDSEFETDKVVDDVADHFADAQGLRDLRDLLNAVAEEEPQRAWTVLERILGVVAKIKHENEY